MIAFRSGTRGPGRLRARGRRARPAPPRNLGCLPVTDLIVGFEVTDVRFPTSRDLSGSDAMNPDPDYSAAYVVLRTDERDGGARVRVHDRPRHRGAGRRHQGDGAARRRPGRRRDVRRHGRVLAQVEQRQSAAVARSREGRHAHGARCRRQRGVGHVRQARAQAALEAARRPVSAADRRSRRLPLPDRRADAGAGSRDPRAGSADCRRARENLLRRRVPRPTRRPPAGSGTATRR